MSKEFKIVLIIFVVVAAICAIVYFSVGDPNDAKKETKEEKTNVSLKSDIPKGISLKNENITIENGSLSFSVTIVNKNKQAINLKEVNVKVIGDKNKEISDLVIPIDAKVNQDEEIFASSGAEVSYKGKTTKAIYSFKTN